MAGASKVRNGEIRIRVRDCVMDMGHGDIEAGIERFIDHALWVAKQKDLRLWNDSNIEMKDTARGSLHACLGIRKVKHGNVYWVLDIWEAACDDWFRTNPPTPEPVPTADEVDQMVNPDKGPLSSRILDAYLNKDADRMLECLGELERKGL